MAQRLDLDAGELLGEPIPLGVELPQNLVYAGVRAMAASGGTFAYQVGIEPTNRLVWVSRDGNEEDTVFEGHGWLNGPRLSRDGERIAVSDYEGTSAAGTMWILDPRRNNTQRMSFSGRDDQLGLWSLDGEALFVYGVQIGAADAGIFRMDARRPRVEELVKLVPGSAISTP